MSQSKIERIDTNHVMSSATIFNKVVYLSGQVPKNTELDVLGQTKEVLSTIDGLLAQAKTDKSRILSAQLFLKNLDDFQIVNTIWIDWLKGDQTPARATIQADLVNPDWLIEIAVIAAQYD
jgi:enamine deaminase RidA (YjgF/YER057c/UK114 family)